MILSIQNYNKMLLIQLYPFTYLDSSNNNLLLYNTLNNKFKFIKNNVSIHVENRTSLILDENTINSNIASEIAQEQYGYIHFTQSLSNMTPKQLVAAVPAISV